MAFVMPLCQRIQRAENNTTKTTKHIKNKGKF